MHTHAYTRMQKRRERELITFLLKKKTLRSEINGRGHNFTTAERWVPSLSSLGATVEGEELSDKDALDWAAVGT